VIIRKRDEDKRKKAIEEFEKKISGFKVILVKWGGGYTWVIVSEADYEFLQQNPPLKGKGPFIIVGMGIKPTTRHIISVEWFCECKLGGQIKTQHIGIDGSIVYINDAGESIGTPGIISRTH